MNQFNLFIQSAKRLIYPHGVSLVITSVSEAVYNIETGTATSTETSKTVIAFPKTVKVSSYNYPNLIGKSLTEFLVVATDLTSAPRPLDRLTMGTEVLTVDSVSEHVAGGSVVIYKVLAVKG